MRIFNCSFLPKPIAITEQRWDKNIPPLVSISCIAYNHAAYIRETIEGFLIQKTTFPVEILIHDDASTDETRQIIQDYEEKYPRLISPIYQTENQHNKGKKISLTYQFPRVRGKYIALCEGDDYWTNPLKLQKQVDFLENNPDYSMCCHASKVIYENSLKESEFERPATNDKTFTLDYFFEPMSKCVFRTMSVIFRTEYAQILPQWFHKIIIGDYPLFLFLAHYGKIRYFNQAMGVYRKHINGIWTSNYKKPEYIEKYYLNTIEMYQYFDEYSNFVYHAKINERIPYRYYQMLQQVKNHKVLYKKFVWKYFWKIPIHKRSEVLNEIYVQPGKEIIIEFFKIPHRIIRKIFLYITKIRKSSKKSQ